ncbi:MAG: iron export ABC transporter permease subunit FetB [Alphaproteobacteria bacterium]|nr:iron export ABC transporter permease subunit FetB [Alphaproteobacteria bacterium]
MSPVDLGPADLALSALLLLLPAVVSVLLRLGLEGRLAVAAARTVVQLSVLGLVLQQVFALDRWYLVLPVLSVMLLAAARAAVQRARHRVRGVQLDALLALVVAASTVTFSTTELVLQVEHWYAPRYVIPLLGMVLGNGLTGVALALDRLLSSLLDARDVVEARLTLGQPVRDAVRPWLAEAVRTGMIPMLNTMTIVGLVSLPGMMTGQILAGADPLDAVAWQILIMFMIASATAGATILLCLLVMRRLVDPLERVRWEEIRPA